MKNTWIGETDAVLPVPRKALPIIQDGRKSCVFLFTREVGAGLSCI